MERAFAAWDSLYICGRENFWERMRATLHFQHPAECNVTIADEWPLEPPFGSRIPGGEASLRAALRQDPDCVIVPQAEEMGPLLLQAALTGHRVLAGFDLTPRQVLQQLLGEALGQLATTQTRSLFFQADGLYVYDSDRDTFEQVSQFDGESFRDLTVPVEPPPPPPPPPLPPLEAPAEWGPARPLLPELETIFAPLARTCHAPIFGHGEAIAQFGGPPRLAEQEQWPRCGACEERLHLVCELDLSRLPDPQPLPAQGWLQLFYCTSDSCHHSKAWGPFSNNALARRLTGGHTTSLEPVDPRHPQKNVTEWLALTDYPGWEERPQLDDRQRTASYNLEEPAFLEHFCLDEVDREKAAAYFRNYPGDKLCGWPAWSQAAEYPACPECGESMRMLFQVNNDGHSEREPGYNSCHGQIFAADGNGHIFVCANHPHQLTFSWACG